MHGRKQLRSIENKKPRQQTDKERVDEQSLLQINLIIPSQDSLTLILDRLF